MDYTMSKKLSSMSVEMNIVKKLCKINEYKGEQYLYKRQPKAILLDITDNAIIKFVHDTYIDDFKNDDDKLLDLINNNKVPKSRGDIGVVEFRDVIKTVNSAYEDIEICSSTILELHGYLHRYSLVRGGRYKSEESDELYDNNQIKIHNNLEKYIERDVKNLCENYYELIEEDQIDILLIIATFIMDFIIISPFKEDNVKMAKILTLLLLNKNGYEVGRFTSLGKIYNEESQTYFKVLFSNKRDLEREYYNINKWLDYFLNFILNSYEKLSDELNLTGNKKETKTRRIEKVINSTLGYFTKDDIRLQCPDIPEPTINRVFNNLRKDGKIEVVAKGRSAKWKKR
ncbi:MAG: cell filamentation protein Fic [Terrisporobacter sp.]